MTATVSEVRSGAQAAWCADCEAFVLPRWEEVLLRDDFPCGDLPHEFSRPRWEPLPSGFPADAFAAAAAEQGMLRDAFERRRRAGINFHRVLGSFPTQS